MSTSDNPRNYNTCGSDSGRDFHGDPNVDAHIDRDLGTRIKIIDDKFRIEVRRGIPTIVKRRTGEPIPDDEPLFLVRARDSLACELLRFYSAVCSADVCTGWQLETLAHVISRFEAYKHKYPDRMKQPGKTRAGRWSGWSDPERAALSRYCAASATR